MDLSQFTGVYKAADVTPYQHNHAAWFPMPGEELVAMYKSATGQLVILHWPEGMEEPEATTYDLLLQDDKLYWYAIKDKVDGLTSLMDVVEPVMHEDGMIMQHEYYWSDETHWRSGKADGQIRSGASAHEVGEWIRERKSHQSGGQIAEPYWRCIPVPPTPPGG